jgi:RNA polymerase sigma-70 factor, ECF subfamily
MSEAITTPGEKVLVEHATFVRELCRGMFRDEHLAQDVAQEALLAGLARGLSSIRNPRAWLSAVARNLARRVHRSKARRDRREHVAARPEGVRSAAEDAARLETQQRVVSAVRNLPEHARSVVILRYMDDVGPSEIARRLGVPVRTVESRLRRALAELRCELAGEAPGSRRAGLMLLAGWSPPGATAAGGITLIGGGAVMTIGKKLGLVAAAILLVIGIVLVVTPRDEDRRHAADPRLPSTTAGSDDPPVTSSGAAAMWTPEEPRPVAVNGKTIRARFLGPDGSPLSGVAVRLARVPQSRVGNEGSERAVYLEGTRILRVLLGTFAIDLGEDTAVTDADGVFELPIADGVEDAALVFIDGPIVAGRFPDPRSIRYFLPADSLRGNIVQMPAPGKITGRIHDVRGNPKAGNLVQCWPESLGLDVAALRDRHVADFSTAAGGPSQHSRHGMRAARTDAEGRFVLVGLPPGNYLVRTGRIQDALRGVRVREGLATGPLDIRSNPPRPPLISGRVIDAGTGEPVPCSVSSSFVDARGAQGVVRGSRTTSDGRFELSRLPVGEHTLLFRAKGYRPIKSGPYRLSGSGRVTELEITLRREP